MCSFCLVFSVLVHCVQPSFLQYLILGDMCFSSVSLSKEVLRIAWSAMHLKITSELKYNMLLVSVLGQCPDPNWMTFIEHLHLLFKGLNFKWHVWHWSYFKEVSCSPGQTPIPHCILPIQSILDVTSGMVKDPPDVLDRQKCLDALAALRHAKWFQVRNIILLSSCSLMRD